MRTISSTIVALAAVIYARAEEAKWNVTSECRMIVIPQKLALSLLPALNDVSKFEGAFARLEQSIADGEATLAAHLTTKSRDKERTESESAEEFVYATEYDPPSLPANAPNDIKVLKAWPVVGITPTAFTTRNIGASLQLEAALIEGGKSLAIGGSVQHLRFLRWAKTDAGTLADGKQLFVEQPIFHTAKNTISMTVSNAQQVIVGVHKLVEPADSWEIFLLKVSASPAL